MEGLFEDYENGLISDEEMIKRLQAIGDENYDYASIICNIRKGGPSCRTKRRGRRKN